MLGSRVNVDPTIPARRQQVGYGTWSPIRDKGDSHEEAFADWSRSVAPCRLCDGREKSTSRCRRIRREPCAGAGHRGDPARWTSGLGTGAWSTREGDSLSLSVLSGKRRLCQRHHRELLLHERGKLAGRYDASFYFGARQEQLHQPRIRDR